MRDDIESSVKHGSKGAQPVDHASEELDIYGITASLAKHSRKIKLVGAVFLAIWILLLFVYKSKQGESQFLRYSVEIALQFKGINDKKYPDGSNFNPNDIVSSDIVLRTYQKNHLEGIVSESDFVEAFSAAYKNTYKPTVVIEKKPDGTPNMELPKNETLYEIINPSQVKIYLDSYGGTRNLSRLAPNAVDMLMKDILTMWGYKFKDQYLSFNMPDPLRIIAFDNLDSLGYGEIYEMLGKNLDLFLNSADKLRESIDLSKIRSRKHNLSLEEALFYVQTNLKRQLSAWYSIPLSWGIYKDEERRKAFLNKQLFDLATEKKFLEKTNKTVRQTLENIRNPQKSLDSERQLASVVRDEAFKSTELPTIDDSLLERIFKSGQINQNINLEYVQKLTDRYLKDVETIARLEMEIAKVESDIENIVKTKETLSNEKKGKLRKEIDENLQELVTDYKKWVTICLEIANESVEAELGKYGGIYTITSPITMEHVNPTQKRELFSRYVKTPGVLLLLLFLGYCSFLAMKEGYLRYKESHLNQ